MQRKLTSEELDDIAETKDRLFKWLGEYEWLIGSVSHKLGEMYVCATSDGKPWIETEPEVVIDDKWAAVWPRRLVMVRDKTDCVWSGPRLLGHVDSIGDYRFVCIDGTRHRFCRPATAEEIAPPEPPEPVEPAKPEIGEGYRLATEADKDRRDREIWNGECWYPSSNSIVGAAFYRVPVDRIPTDEDAKQRPVVMVRDADDQEWIPRKLLGVIGERVKFVACLENRLASAWKYCRFPYPGELD